MDIKWYLNIKRVAKLKLSMAQFNPTYMFYFLFTPKVALMYNVSEWTAWEEWTPCSDDCRGKNTHKRYRGCPVPGQCEGVYQEWWERTYSYIACTYYNFIYFEPHGMSGVPGALVHLPVDLGQRQE